MGYDLTRPGKIVEGAGFAVPGKARFSVVMLVVGGDRQHIGPGKRQAGENLHDQAEGLGEGQKSFF